MQQAAVQNTPAPAAPQAVVAPNAPTPTPASSGTFTMPTTPAELSALIEARSDLSDQLISAANRREELAKDLIAADPGARPGLQARIDLLDARILKIEQDIALTGNFVARSRTTIQGTDTSFPVGPFGNLNMNLTPIGILFTLFVLAPIALTMARAIWRRGSLTRHESVIERENADRLARLEQAVDTIAVEMERVSEGQRFVTKLLSDAQKREHARIESARD